MATGQMTDEWKKNISNANKGRKLSEEHKEKLRLAKIGRKKSEEHKAKQSAAAKGKMPKFIPSAKGTKKTQEQKENISRIVKAKWDSGEIKGGWNKGKRNPNANIHQPGYYSFIEKRRQLRKKENGGTYTFKEWCNLKILYLNTCPSCYKKEPDIKLTVDHIKPLSKGGRDDIDNIQPLCMSCNSKKGIKEIKYDIPIAN